MKVSFRRTYDNCLGLYTMNKSWNKHKFYLNLDQEKIPDEDKIEVGFSDIELKKLTEPFQYDIHPIILGITYLSAHPILKSNRYRDISVNIQ